MQVNTRYIHSTRGTYWGCTSAGVYVVLAWHLPGANYLPCLQRRSGPRSVSMFPHCRSFTYTSVILVSVPTMFFHIHFCYSCQCSHNVFFTYTSVILVSVPTMFFSHTLLLYLLVFPQCFSHTLLLYLLVFSQCRFFTYTSVILISVLTVSFFHIHFCYTY